MNDSKNPPASHKDRHACLGEGTIGAKLLRLRERIIKDTGEQDYSTSLCRKWLDEHTTKTVHDAVSLASSHELKKPD